MKTKDIPAIAAELMAKMAVDGFSQETIETTRWVTGLFQKYCDDKGYDEADIPVAVEFLKGGRIDRMNKKINEKERELR